MGIDLRIPSMLASCLLASACVGYDSVLFVTTTNIGIDVDRAPPNVSIAYDRYEGYFGPAYETGALPPVVARLESNTSVFSPEIRQLYATGDAANLITQKKQPPPEKPLKRTGKRVAFFGTGSVVGLKVAFDPNGLPQSLALGYKRKEFSLIPVMEGEADTDTYGSVLASFGINIETPNLPTTEFGVDQVFATGTAAENLAASDETIRNYFKLQVQEGLQMTTLESDDNTRILDERIKADPAYEGRLRAWLTKLNNPECRIIAQLRTAACTEVRRRAVAEVN